MSGQLITRRCQSTMDDLVSVSLAGLVAGYIRASTARRSERIGPFLAGFDLHSADPWRNYAVPDDGARPTPAEVAALVDAFVARGRTPRLEYVPQAAPE